MLGIDFGERRIGLALSEGRVAVPLTLIEHTNRVADIERIAAVAREHGVTAVIVGLPLSLSGRDSQQTVETRAFAAKLAAAVTVSVELYDERFTTKLAAQAGGSASLDSRAAATLLDEWLTLPIREENPPPS